MPAAVEEEGVGRRRANFLTVRTVEVPGTYIING